MSSSLSLSLKRPEIDIKPCRFNLQSDVAR